jgi:hypothetical protein
MSTARRSRSTAASPRRCRMRANRFNGLRAVIARSKATKQSILSLRGEMDCFASLAMTVNPTYIRVLAARNARGIHESFARKRAQGTPGACCTRGLACNMCIRTRTRAYRYSRSIPASLRNGFTAYAALSPATNSSCHRRQRINGFATPGWADENLRRLDTSNGCQDHTVLPYAAACAKGLDGLGTRPPKL